MEQGMLMNSAAASPAASPLSRAALWFQKEEISWFAVMGLVFLAVNSTSTILRSLHDPTTVAFVVFSNADVVLLYWCMSQFDTAGAKRKESLKAAVWILATLLTGVFCQRIAGMMPPTVDAIVWGMAAVSISGSFYALFVYRDAGPIIGGKL
ncbi:hypothetical protein KSP39_PZI006237 [Platanthera zijinensis]|uniref:Uncharacterized protein n=1 Tax=Platanthera zijinensis TaxID=2320716 RepID=A0AAP0BRL6_9ASPA